MPPAPGNTRLGRRGTNPVEIGAGRCVMRCRCSVLGICWVAEIHAFDRARAMPPGPPWSSRDAVTSAPLAPTTAIAAAQAELLGLVDGALHQRAGLGQREVARVGAHAPTML